MLWLARQSARELGTILTRSQRYATDSGDILPSLECLLHKTFRNISRYLYTPSVIISNPDLIQALFSSIIVYNFALFSTKLSILLQYLRICSKSSTRKAVYVVIAIVSAYCLETFFTGLFTCTPVAFFWDSTIPNGNCLEKWPLYFANAAINIATDFMILLLPIFILKDLMMPKMQKYFLMAIIALGGMYVRAHLPFLLCLLLGFR